MGQAGDGQVSVDVERDPPMHLAGHTGLTGDAELRRLKLIGIVLPVVFIAGAEAVRLIFVEGPSLHRGHIILCLLVVSAVISFGITMFFRIDHAHRLILRRNRELAAINAVSTAVRGDLGVDQIIDAALESMVVSTGAVEVSVTASVPAGRLLNEDVVTWRRVAEAGTGVGVGVGHDSEAASQHIVDVPLLAGTSTVGTMRLRLAEGTGEPDRAASEALQNIGQQLGSAIKHAQLISDLQRRKREGHALYDILLRISAQGSPVDTLAATVRIAQDLLDADEAKLCLRHSASGFLSLDNVPAGSPPSGAGLVCVAAEGASTCATGWETCPVRSTAPQRGAVVSAPLRGSTEALGEIWLRRRAQTPFGHRDESFLVTLAELSVVALAHARTLENERHGAMLAERERIAREMHDSLAQVLGVAHLRLCALVTRPETTGAPELEAELTDLAGITKEAYHDVREAILGLHESSRTDRALLEGLRAYVEKFSRQSGVATTLESSLDDDLALTPRSEVQVIRVIQEALTNVRKHSGARSAAVRITGTPELTRFVVEDDGRGFDLSAVPADRDGFGLHSMRERITLVKGSLTIDSAPGRGTRVIIGVPGPGGTISLPEAGEA